LDDLNVIAEASDTKHKHACKSVTGYRREAQIPVLSSVPKKRKKQYSWTVASSIRQHPPTQSAVTFKWPSRTHTALDDHHICIPLPRNYLD